MHLRDVFEDVVEPRGLATVHTVHCKPDRYSRKLVHATNYVQ